MLDLFFLQGITVGMATTIQIPGFSLSSTQIGKIAESLVAAQLMMASNGRLSPFAPLADDDGTDLVVVDKLTGRQSRIQVKCRRASRNAPPGTVQFDVRKKTLSATPDNYLLYVLLDPDPGLLWRAWLVPAVDLENVAMDKKTSLSLRQNLHRHQPINTRITDVPILVNSPRFWLPVQGRLRVALPCPTLLRCSHTEAVIGGRCRELPD